MKEKTPIDSTAFPTHSSISSSEILDCFVPQIDLYNIAKLEKAPREDNPIDYQQEIKKNFKDNLLCSFGLQGDLTGHVLAAISEVQGYQSELIEKYHEGLFIESVNVAMGQMLSALDQQYSLLSTLQAPILIRTSIKDKTPEFIKKEKFKNYLLMAIDNYRKLKTGYVLHYQRTQFPIDVYLIFRFKEHKDAL